MMKFAVGERVLIVGRECAAVVGRTGTIVGVKEQEPTSSNFYTVKIDDVDRRGEFGVFEYEMEKCP